jgi:hypothetical protein
MTDEQRQRIHDIEYSCDSRAELAERIVALENELANWEKLTAGVELPEYPITQFHPKDLERENAKLHTQLADVTESMGRVEERCAKLRELVRKYGEYTSQDRCEGCVCKSRCNDGDVDECWQLTEIRGLAREVGIKVY